jgi:hypothetical protein
VTEIESVVKPYRVLNDFGGKSISFVDAGITHSAIVAELQLSSQYRKNSSYTELFTVSDKVIFKRADWTSIAQDEVLNFPSNSPTVHDDIIDALALIARKMPFISTPSPKQAKVIKHAFQIGPDGSICTSDTLGDLFELNENQSHKPAFQKLRI